jgi:uncharacterized membrane protein
VHPRRKPPPPPSAWRTLGKIFVTGLLTVLPLGLTVYFVIWLLGVLEVFFGRQLIAVIPDAWYYTGMGLAVAVVLVFAVGMLMHAIAFRRLFRFTEWVLLEIPLVRSVYSAMRDLLGLFAEHKEPALQVVSVALPGDIRLLGFVTRTDLSDAPPGIARADEVAVYLPMSYQLGGYTIFLPRAALTPVEMSREDAMKFVLTAGLKTASPGIEPPGEGPKPPREVPAARPGL